MTTSLSRPSGLELLMGSILKECSPLVLEIQRVELPDKSGLRLPTLMALMRRILVVSKGIENQIDASLFETSASLSRTLLELGTSFSLIRSGEGDELANCYKASVLRDNIKKGEAIIASAQSKDSPLYNKEEMDELSRRLQSFQERYQAEITAEVRQQFERRRFWHGYGGMMEAMESVGIGTLYRCAYELYSPFVHNASLDWDVQASGESGVLLKPIFTSDTIQYDGPRMVVCWVVSQSTFGLINEYLDVWSHIRSNKAEEVTTKLRSLKAIAFPLHSRVCEVFDANFNNL